MIAYDSDQDGNVELYVINSDGAGEQRLTNNAAADSNPWWSSDGAKVAFQSSRNGNLDIFMMDAFSGANPILLLTGSTDEKMPSWGK
ncbi:MAG: PD40 domain-containing protein [Chloroflexi bacterium]|nr:PD40 domain-containing protein [Chloroflexota bacterium]